MKKRHIVLGAATIALLTGMDIQSAKAIDLQISGFVRQEIAVKITGQRNQNNQAGDPFNGVAMPWTGASFGAAATGVTQRPGSYSKDNTFNQFDTRFELNLDSHLSDSLTAHVKLRGVYNEIGRVEDAFRGTNFYGGSFGYGHNSGGNLLEVTSKDAMLDLPSAYVDYNNGALWLRAGNQQIAWGEALFFRVADQVDGIDLRRHSVLGVAGEEYSDTRVPSPGLRGSYHFEGDNDITIEAYAQKFSPTILPALNDPYNPIPSQFYIDDREGYDKVSGEMNFGVKVTGSIADYGLAAFAMFEHDANGVFQWAAARNTGPLNGQANPTYFGGALATAPGGTFNNPAVPATNVLTSAFTTNPTGVYSAQEWLYYAAMSRLDGINGLNTSLNNFPIGAVPGAGLGVANACSGQNGGPSNWGAGQINITNQATATCVLNTFFFSGALTGFLSREYPYQKIFGTSINHIFEGEPDSFLDQLIARVEVSYTPNKKFTAADLGTPKVHGEYQIAGILEKYYKFSTDFPATYMVGQYLHKSKSDIFGRYTGNLDTAPGYSPRGQTGGTNYFAFAMQQPSPTLKYRFDFTMLSDAQGGWLFQPGVKYKPSEHLQFDLYSNLVYSTASANTYTNFAQGAEWAREVFVRATYYF